MAEQETKPRVRIHTEAPSSLPLGDTPTQTVVKAAALTGDAVDERGRRITVKRLTAIDRMRLFSAAGSELSKNDQWIGLAALAASCIAIDGDQVPKPVSRLQIEALVDRLGDEGIAAVGEGYQKTFGVGAEEGE